MTPKQKNRLFTLFTALETERLTEAEHSELQELLRADPDARQLWFVHQDIGVGLSSSQGLRVPPVKTARKERWLSWRPVTAAAAGLMIGVFSSSLVFGFTMLNKPHIDFVLFDSFEDRDLGLQAGIPTAADVWSGNVRGWRAQDGEVIPAEGQSLVTLPKVEKRRFSYAYRIVDMAKFPMLALGQSRQLEVTARFRGTAKGVRNSFQIRLATFIEDSATASRIWEKDQINERALNHVVKTEHAEDTDWITVRSVVDVPAQTTTVFMSLAAANGVNEPSSHHFLDDVKIRLITHDKPLLEQSLRDSLPPDAP
jgi:hypothetical protein